ncbi:MAG: ABC transporter ATP-binding protein, partial [Clostridia bacterium]|nr:ABC transporter ATP-binding protein [Clostridia bacterium]
MKQKNYSKTGMVFSFLKTSKRFFVLSTLSALLVSIFELLSPQIVRFTVDSVIGTEPPDLPQFIIDIIDRIGG